MTALNVAGSTFVARVQSLVVFVVVGILAVFAAVTIANMHPALLAPSGYPGVQDIVSGVALTFFAFLGFGVVTFTAKDLADPAKQLPRAMAIAIGLATAIYIAVAIGVFGTLTVPEVIAAGPTAIAVAAQPVLGQAGYWLMSITALFATAGATNAGLYPATGLSDELAATGQFPKVMARPDRRPGVGRARRGGCRHPPPRRRVRPVVGRLDRQRRRADDLRPRHGRPPAGPGGDRRRVSMLVLALLTTGITLLTFVVTTLIHEPASIATLIAILVVSILLDVLTARMRTPTAGASEAVAG